MHWRFFFCLLLLLTSTGCLEVETRVVVNAQGSGRVIETIRVNLSGMETFARYLARQVGPDHQPPTREALIAQVIKPSRKKLERLARRMRGDTKLASVRALPEREGSVGLEVVYRFEDVRTLRVRMDPNQKSPAASPIPRNRRAPRRELSFDFRSGSSKEPHVLRINVPPRSSAAPPEKTDALPPDLKAILQEILPQLRARIIVEVEGTLARTDAKFREGNQIHLLDADFAPLAKRPALWPRLAAARGLDEALAALPEAREEPRKTVEILFRSP